MVEIESNNELLTETTTDSRKRPKPSQEASAAKIFLYGKELDRLLTIRE